MTDTFDPLTGEPCARPCSIDHSDPDTIPAFLCRACNPDMNRTPTERAKLDAADRAIADAKRAAESHDREVRLTRAKLESLTKNGEPTAESVSGKIAASLRKKLDRLTKETKK